MPLTLSAFQTPEAEWRPWTRWWWPGGDVELDELRREVRLFAAVGFGGAEIQPFVAGINRATINDPHARIHDYGSPAYYAKLAAVLEEARAQGLQIDLTLNTGWPAGGTFVPLDDNVDTLLYGEMTVTRAVIMPVPPPQMPFNYALFSPHSVLPLLRGREWTQTLTYHPEKARLVAVVAARIVDNQRSPDPSVLTDTLTLDPASALDISAHVRDGYLEWTPPDGGPWQVIAVYTMPSGSRTLLTADYGESYAVDPFDSAAIQRFYDTWLGTHPEILRYAGTTLRALFSDSYEYFAQRHFADDLIETFRAQRGYEVTPLLPAVFQPGRDQMFFFFTGLRAAPDFSFGPVSARVIYDYDLTVSDLFFKHWYPVSRQWAESRGLLFRQQGYNPPLDVIRAAGAASIPETEGGNELLLKRVASGGHLYGRPLITAEAFVFFPQGGYALTPQDYRQGIDTLMTAGVNQIIYHGTPYRWPEPGYGETGWAPFITPYGGTNITGNFSEADPFWPYQPQINRYAARLQYLLRQGAPDADLLVYLPLFSDPNDAAFAPALDTLNTHGWAWEWVNDDCLGRAEWTGRAIRVGEMQFRGIVLPNVAALPLATAEALQRLAAAGAPVAVLGDPPARQPGYHDYQTNDQRVAQAVKTLAHTATVAALAGWLAALPQGPIRYAPNPALRFIRRRLDDGGYIAFVRNTSAQPTALTLTLAAGLRAGYWCDAVNGSIHAADIDNGQISGWLPGYGALALIASPQPLFSADQLAPGSPAAEPVIRARIPLENWTLIVDGITYAAGAALGDWRERDDLRYVASPGMYTTHFHLDALEPDTAYVLDLGAVHAAAEVTVNGQAAGLALFAPYTVDISAPLRTGDNTLTVTVIPPLHNRLLGKGLSGDPEYSQFVGGPPFGPRRPVPSGLAGPVALTARPKHVSP